MIELQNQIPETGDIDDYIRAQFRLLENIEFTYMNTLGLEQRPTPLPIYACMYFQAESSANNARGLVVRIEEHDRDFVEVVFPQHRLAVSRSSLSEIFNGWTRYAVTTLEGFPVIPRLLFFYRGLREERAIFSEEYLSNSGSGNHSCEGACGLSLKPKF